MFSAALSRLHSYWYNRSWHNLEPIANGPLVKLTLGIPLAGYLLLFNDTVTSQLTFKKITSYSDIFFFDSTTKLQLIYFGLVTLALSNLWYRYRRPDIIRQATTPDRYVSFGVGNFTVFDFIQVFGSVEASHRGPLTGYWEFSKADLDRFVEDAAGNQISSVSGFDLAFSGFDRSMINSRQSAIDRHSEFVRSLLLEHFAQRSRQRKYEQQFVLTLALFGYLFLAIPSIDLFFTVLRASILS